jgi:hypothetical protein
VNHRHRARAAVPLCADPHVRSIMLEVRRDLYMDEVSGEPDDAALHGLGTTLARLIDAASG